MCFGKAKRSQTKAFLVQWRKVSPLFRKVMALWWEHYALSIGLSLATLFWCSLPFLNNSQLLSSKVEYKIGKVLHFLCLSGVRAVSWYARASVCCLQGGQLHLKIMSSLVWKLSAIFCRRQRHQCRDPQANIQPSGMCYKKGRATSTIWTEHFALHPYGKPVSRAYPMAAFFLKSLEPAANGNGLLSGFLCIQ